MGARDGTQVLGAAVAGLMLALLALPASAGADGFGLAKPNALAAASPAAAPLAAAAPFRDTAVITGLTNPTNIRFASDGRIFVAQKNGLILIYHGLSDTSPTVFADLRTEVDDYWDRGLLGLALDPGFPSKPYVYALYTRDAPLGGTPPVWNDACPDPPGPTTNGCVVSGRLVRLTAGGDTATATTVLIDDWCQQFPSHSIGDLQFGPDGSLLATAGDGASFNSPDYGQFGSPKNPCGDPPAQVGGTMSPPSAEGGSLRSQDVRDRTDPTSLDGSLIRVDAATGSARGSNPLFVSSDLNARKILAHGFRNPFRFTVRPGSGEIWVGDVGWNTWEEIDRIPSTTKLLNFGWPCYEGDARQASFDALNLSLCESLYASPSAATAPFYAYSHGAKVTSGESCPVGSSSLSGITFYTGSSYPSLYQGGLFFADYSRDCIWAMPLGSDGQPDPTKLQALVTGAASPVDLVTGPNGDLFYPDLTGGTIHRIQYFGANRPPVAVAKATPTSGPAPLTVAFDGTGSSDPDVGDSITYAWDLDGDGAYDDSTSAKPSFTYSTGGTHTARLRVTDTQGLTDTTSVTVAVGSPPTAHIGTPTPATTWKVGDRIAFSGSASDPQDGTVPASGLTWSVILHHCSTTGSCHTHPVQDFTGVASGSFPAPDHEYPSWLEVRLTATDSLGLSDTESVRIDPQTTALTFATSPSGLLLTVGSSAQTTPFTRTVIVGSRNVASATGPQNLRSALYDFASWSDGGARSHEIVAPASATTYTATYRSGTLGATLFGEKSVKPVTDSNPAGTAQAFRAAQGHSGTAAITSVWMDSASTATKLVVGIYTDSNGHPGRLLTQATMTAPPRNWWARVAVPGVAVKAFTTYWIAVLNPPGTGTLIFRDAINGGGRSETSASGNLTTLPSTWATGSAFTDGPLSAYVSAAGS